MPFFTFEQNNSGGSFDIDDDVTQYVIIEADDSIEANYRAEQVGIYFDGCDKGMDCECCGNRWHPMWGNGDETPMIYGESPENFKPYLKKGPYCYVYYKDGKKSTFEI